MFNKLGHYIFKRICKDQTILRKKQAMNMYGLYVRATDIRDNDRFIDMCESHKKQFDFVKADLRNFQECKMLVKGIDVVFHEAIFFLV